ncbi:hypothetical protein BGW37DRAFT_83215 [Umbelopsis sp. PMI_123]|nr:hypothetical protein BGW37DRAFT_83215 [Umbelopsis sp. PMI_123]
MKNSLSSITCPNTCSVKDRLYSAIEELIADLANRDDQEVHANIMFLVLSKRNDEKGYEFLEEADETTSSKLDLLAVLYKSMRKLRTSNIANINFELMRLFPGDVPNDITDRPQEKLLPNLSISAINLSIANGTFEQVLRDRSMKSFDLSNIDIIFSGNDTSSNIDDKSVRVLFAHQNEHLEDKIWMNNIQLDHVMTVRKHGLDLPLCRCLHPLAINDPRFETSSLHSSLSDRSIILLHDRKDENKAYYYTNAITQYGTNAFLLCFNRTPDDVFEKTKEQALEVVEVKVEGWTNPSRMDKIASQANFIFSKEMITGNTIEDMCDIKELVNINPHRYALPPGDIDLLPECNNVRTTERIDRTSRWWLSMADSVSRVMISSHGVSPLQNYGDAFKMVFWIRYLDNLRLRQPVEIMDNYSQNICQVMMSGNIGVFRWII